VAVPALKYVAVVVAALVLTGCGADAGSGRAGPSNLAPEAATTNLAPEAATTGPAPEAATTTTTAPCPPAPIEQRAASVLMLGIGNATTAEAALPARLSALGVGGVILLGVNVVDAAQLRSLIDGMRRKAPRHLLVAVDEEGGRVSRLKPIIGPTPSARSLGQRPLEEIAGVAAQRGTVLRDLGFDVVLAPVVDADGGPANGAIGDRAFATSPADAGARAAAFAEGLRPTGVAAAAKHFPGQGGLADSHDGAVVSDAPMAQVARAAADGFGPVLRAGVAAVMMSHVTFSALGSRPASIEPAAYRLLRSMGFEGVAITDAVGMSAIGNQWSLGEAAVLALAAGADLVLATPADRAAAMRDAITAAVADGRLSEARLNEAVRRVAALGGQRPSALLCA
jgi:beta-N-acetylhexosaminidase